MQLICYYYATTSVCGGGLPRWLSGKESACQCRRCGFNPWVWKIPWSRKRQPTPVFLPEKFHGQRSLVDYSPWSCRVGQDWATPHTHVCVLFHLAYLRVHYLQFFCVQPIVDSLTFGTDWLFWQGHSLFPGVMLQVYPWLPSVLSFAILGFLKTDYRCWKWLNLDDPWQVPFHGIVNRAFESV